MKPESIQYPLVPWHEAVRFDHPNVRLARNNDAFSIWHMVRNKSRQNNGSVLERPYEEIETIIPSLLVFDDDDDGVVGCAAVEQYDDEHGEIRTVVSNKKGAGKVLMREAVNFSRRLGIREVFLTTSIPDYFLNLDLGFQYMNKWRRILWRNPSDISPKDALPIPLKYLSGTIRQGEEKDTRHLKYFMEQEVRDQNILPWNETDLARHTNDFLVYETPEGIKACIACIPYGKRIMEVRSCVVGHPYNRGILRLMLSACDTVIKRSGIPQVFMTVTDEQKEAMEKFGYTWDKAGKDVLWLTNH